MTFRATASASCIRASGGRNGKPRTADPGVSGESPNDTARPFVIDGCALISVGKRFGGKAVARRRESGREFARKFEHRKKAQQKARPHSSRGKFRISATVACSDPFLALIAPLSPFGNSMRPSWIGGVVAARSAIVVSPGNVRKIKNIGLRHGEVGRRDEGAGANKSPYLNTSASPCGENDRITSEIRSPNQSRNNVGAQQIPMGREYIRGREIGRVGASAHEAGAVGLGLTIPVR